MTALLHNDNSNGLSVQARLSSHICQESRTGLPPEILPSELTSSLSRDYSKHEFYDAVILGAGLAGIGALNFLVDKNKAIIQSNKSYTCLERADRPGGFAKSRLFNGFYFDNGAHICHSNNEEGWLNQLFTDDVLEASPGKASSVYNYKEGKWFGYPIQQHLREFGFNRAEAAIALYDLLAASLNADIDDKSLNRKTYEDFCNANYGKYLTDNFYRLYTRKYWRRELHELSTDWVTGRLITDDPFDIVKNMIIDPNTIMRESMVNSTKFKYFRPSPGGGFEGLIQPVLNYNARSMLPTNGTSCGFDVENKPKEIDPIQLNSTITSITIQTKTNKKLVAIEKTLAGTDALGNSKVEKIKKIVSTDYVLSSIPLPNLVNMITLMDGDNPKNLPPYIAAAASKLKSLTQICVNMVVHISAFSIRTGPAPDWFYIYDNDIHPARVSFPQRLCSNHGTLELAKEDDWVAIQAEIFRDKSIDKDFDPNTLAKETVTQLSKLLSFDPSEEFCQYDVIVNDRSYVVSDLDRAEAAGIIIKWLEGYNIYPIGTFGQWKYMWSDVAYFSGKKAAEKVFNLMCPPADQSDNKPSKSNKENQSD